MKLIIAEGTPEEIRALLPDLEALNGGGIVVAGTPSGPAADDVSVLPAGGATDTLLPADVVEFITLRSSSRHRSLFTEYCEFLLDLGVTFEPRKASGEFGEYMRVYAPGPRRFGAAVYVRPGNGRVDFHLDADALTVEDKAAGAFARDVAADNPYPVRVLLDGAARLLVAKDLARRALEQLGGRGQ
jgi:hypothetical protein